MPATKTFIEATRDLSKVSPELKTALESAGLGFDKLAPMGVLERMKAVGAAIDGMRNPVERARAAAQAFGASGLSMVEALRPGNMDSAAVAIGTQAQLLERNAGVFARVSQLLGVQGSSFASLAQYASQKIQGLFVGIASEVAPQILAVLEASRTGGATLADSIRKFSPALAPLADLVDRLVRFDFAAIGQQIGAGVAMIAQAVRSGDFARYLELAFDVAVENFSAKFNAVLIGFQSTFQALTADIDLSPIWQGAGMALKGVALLFVSTIGSSLLQVFIQIFNGDLFNKIGSIFENLISGFNLQPILDGVGKTLQGIASLFVATITNGLILLMANLQKQFPKIFEATGGIDALNGLLNDVAKSKKEGVAAIKEGSSITSAGFKTNLDAIQKGISGVNIGETLKSAFEKTEAKKKEGADIFGAGSEMFASGLRSNFDAIRKNVGSILPAFQSGYLSAPEADTSLQSDAMAEIEYKTRKNAVNLFNRAQNLFATPGVRTPEMQAPAVQAAARGALGPMSFEYVSSLTKVGGNMFGPTMGGDALQMQRQQLAAQQAQVEKQNQTNVILLQLREKLGSTSAYQ